MARAMKDSQIPWIGNIPESWHVDKVKYHLRRNEPRNPGNQVVLSVYREYGVIPKDSRDDNHNVTSDDTSKYKYVKPGNLVINKMKAWQGSMGVSSYEGIVSPAYFIYEFVDNVVYDKYLHYLFRSCYRDEFRRISGGIREGQWDLSPDLFAVTLFLVPDKQEQILIVRFLDNKCAEIDALMTDIQAQIETLEQYKRSVITEAVTKGLNSNVPLQNSSTDWIGQVPIHWSISKIKYEIIPIERSVYETDGIITCFRNGEVTLRSNRREEGFTISLTEHGYHGVDVGDLVIHGMDAFAGAIGCSDSRGKITPVVHVCRTTGNNRFFMYFLRTMAYGDILMDLSDGVRIRSSDYRNFSKLGKLSICVPPLDEQDKIVDYLDSKVKQIDDVITQKQEQLEILEEYKKSVVFEYVTGKKEVPISCPQSAMKQ